jgi:uncharacterized protein YndB with AHSA1/START domain
MSQQTPEAVIIQRTIAAPPEKVFAAWTDPGLLAQWWGPPGTHVTSVEIDLQINGRYRIGLQQPNHDIYFVNGTYQLIQPPEKLIFTWHWEQPSMDIGQSLVTIEIRRHGPHSNLTLTHAQLPQPARASHRQGWQGILHNLATFLNQPPLTEQLPISNE